MYSKKTMN